LSRRCKKSSEIEGDRQLHATMSLQPESSHHPAA
jgi:hypothetical protein